VGVRLRNRQSSFCGLASCKTAACLSPDLHRTTESALIALLADSGLRISEALRLRIENRSLATRTLEVRGGQGGKDGVGFFGADVQHLQDQIDADKDRHRGKES